MAREISRAQGGHFPTQERIIPMIAAMFKADLKDDTKPFVLLDAGCGEGTALATFRKECCPITTYALGVEMDRGRAQTADTNLDEVLWASLSEATVDGHVSLLWFNPPYDQSRNSGRMETELLKEVFDWTAPGNGLIIAIVPDYVIGEASFCRLLERHYEMEGVWRYPEPEYQQWKQCVYVGRRRDQSLGGSYIPYPSWAHETFPVLGEGETRSIPIYPCRRPRLRRTKVSPELLNEVIQKSPLRHLALQESTSQEPDVGRPLLPLKDGHMALALAGGLCDQIVEHDGLRFLLKGTLTSKILKVKTENKCDEDGLPVEEVDFWRTVYVIEARCLREDGTIETYKSNDGEEATTVTEGDDDDVDEEEEVA